MGQVVLWYYRLSKEAREQGIDRAGRCPRPLYSPHHFQRRQFRLSGGNTDCPGHDFQHAFVLRRLGRHEKAKMVARDVVARLSKLVEQNPENEFFPFALPFAYAIQGKRDDALREARTAAHPGAKVVENWGRLLEHGAAMVHILTGDYDTAIGELEYLLSVPSLVTTAKLPSAHLSLDALQYSAHPDLADSRLTSKFGLAGESSASEHSAVCLLKCCVIDWHPLRPCKSR